MTVKVRNLAFSKHLRALQGSTCASTSSEVTDSNDLLQKFLKEQDIQLLITVTRTYL